MPDLIENTKPTEEGGGVNKRTEYFREYYRRNAAHLRKKRAENKRKNYIPKYQVERQDVATLMAKWGRA